MPSRRLPVSRVRLVDDGVPSLLPSSNVVEPIGVEVAWSAICHRCGKTYISVLHKFVTPYICPSCDPRREEYKRWLAENPRCPNGHLRTDATTVLRPNGIRECRLCKRLYAKRAREGRVDSQ